MRFISTRNSNIHKTLSEAIQLGLAEDGGLFVPELFPTLDLNTFTVDLSFPDFAEQLLKPFFQEDILEKELPMICKNAFSFPVPLTKVNVDTFLLELFHGPTSSFKDFGARFLAECLEILSAQHKTTILVATSGDTGSAVASAFYRKANIQVIILYPKGKISERQEHQIACWDTNVVALAVDGSFDDCQRMVKQAFQDVWWRKHLHLSSANSINIARLLPQMTYYAYTSVHFYHQYKTEPGFIIPSGNLGHATAAYWAKKLGFPIREIFLATNANKVVPDYLASGDFNPRPSVATLANAMDVGNPSNFERLQDFFPTFDSFKKNVTAISVTDAEIKKTIQEYYEKYKIMICPHTATGCYMRKQLSDQPWIIAATADPAKFDDIIESTIHQTAPVSAQLQVLLDKFVHIFEIENKLDAIKPFLK